MNNVPTYRDEARFGRGRRDEQIELAKGVATTPASLQHCPPPQYDVFGQGDCAPRKKWTHFLCEPGVKHGSALWICRSGYAEADFGKSHIGYEQRIFGLGGDEGENLQVGPRTPKF